MNLLMRCTILLVSNLLSNVLGQYDQGMCTDYQWPCQDGTCVNVTLFCDGNPDCPYGDDESYCGNHQVCDTDDPEPCESTIFNITENETDSGTFLCSWQISEATIRNSELHFETKDNKTVEPNYIDRSKGIVQCPVPSGMTAYIDLLVQENGTKHVLSTNVLDVYPTKCFDCSDGKSNCRLKNVENDKDVGCLIDDRCYPAFALNVNNKSQTCFPTQSMSSWSVTPESSSDLGTIPLNICELAHFDERYKFKTGIRRARPLPQVEGLDFTMNGTAYDYSPDELRASLTSYAFSIFFLVMFDPSPVAEPVTFMELPPAIKLQRRPDDLIQVEFTFYNLTSGRKVVETVVLQDDEDSSEGWIQLQPFGMKLKVKGNIKEVLSEPGGDWIFVGLGYDARDPSLSFYLQRRKLKKNLGDLSDLQLLFSGNLVVSTASVSCIDTDVVMQELGFFKSPSRCEPEYSPSREDTYNQCSGLL